MIDLTILPLPLYRVLDWPMNTGPNGGYNFWSGIGSGSPLLVPVAVHWRRHKCHAAWCPRVQWKVTAAGDWLCEKHHPEPRKTLAEMHEDHYAALASTSR